MNKEDILAKSRKENKSQDLAEMELDNQAWNLAGRVGVVLCSLLSAFYYFYAKQFSEGPWAIYFCMLGTRAAFRYYKLRKGSELAFAALYFSTAALSLVTLTLQLLGIKP